MEIIEQNEHMIVGVIRGEMPVPHVVVTRPAPIESFPSGPIAIIPLRWLRRAQSLPKQQAEDFLRRKLRTGNVGRKLRRTLRRQSS